jgi:hypothetical protein
MPSVLTVYVLLQVPVEELGLEIFMDEDGTISEVSDLRSIRSMKVKDATKPPPIPSREVFVTQCASAPLPATPHPSLHPRNIKTTIPRGRVIRPVSAAVLEKQLANVEFITATAPIKPPRPGTAPVAKARTYTSRLVHEADLLMKMLLSFFCSSVQS